MGEVQSTTAKDSVFSENIELVGLAWLSAKRPKINVFRFHDDCINITFSTK